ncbi:MAG: phosphatase PAP2 family protein [Proteobacteria bacterium]|uniref:phosphatase PAP2 family protein n=1 Tax=Aquabacterium sp. TaxID=1872578 RepID=UPI0035C7449D|nr:phosphatase PAP2 family protein [Pseudomonadota bacterium]
MPSPPPHPSLPPVGPWRAAWVRLVLGGVLLAAGLALSGQSLDRQWCLATQGALGGWPATWSLLTWSALGICSLLLVACLSDREPRRVAALLVAMLLGGLVVHAIKRSLGVDRPLAVFGADHPVFQVIGEPLRKGSMPSGHTVTAWTVAGLMTLSQAATTSPWRHAWWLLAALQGLSRVVVGAHWPSDVLAGAGIGLLLAPCVWALGATQRLGRWLDRAAVRPWVGGLLPVLALLLCLLDLGSPLPDAFAAAVLGLGLFGALRWSRPPAGRPLF